MSWHILCIAFLTLPVVAFLPRSLTVRWSDAEHHLVTETAFLLLLDELRQAIPEGKTISVAAYPPTTRWHPYPNVHWDESYFRQVARRSDQVAPMMYDTAIKLRKVYRHLMSKWTSEVLDWSEDAEVLFGIPVYDDADVGYHFPHVENLQNALLGIHLGLSRRKALPKNYAGVAIYCEWEMDQEEWQRCGAPSSAVGIVLG